MKKIIAGILISAVLIYLSVKDADFRGVVDGLAGIGYGYIPLFLLIAVLMHALRAWRWGLILRPLARIEALPLFAISNAGFLAITAIPARLGELARPYLVSCRSDVRMSAAVGTIVVERVLDGAAILTIATITPFFTALPAWLLRATVLFFVFNVLLFAGVYSAAYRRPAMWKFLHFFLRKLPERWEGVLSRLLHHFLDGFTIIGNGKSLAWILLLSFMIWHVNVLAVHVLFLAFDFGLPPVAAFVLTVILVIGIAVPAAPGFVGNWHFACVLGLSLFGIDRTEALAFAVIYHFLAVGIVVLLGLGSLPFLHLSFVDLWRGTTKNRDAAIPREPRR